MGQYFGGVELRDLALYQDDRGTLLEVLKREETFAFGQLNLTTSYPGVIKAYHWHAQQTDCWHVVRGALQVVLYDMNRLNPERLHTVPYAERKERLRVVYLSDRKPQVLVIPPGVAHGYRVLGDEPATLLYAVNQVYDPRNPDEHRIPWNAESIGFDWKTQNR